MPKEAYAYLKNYVQLFNIQVYQTVKWKKAHYVVMPTFHYVIWTRRVRYKTELKT